MVKKKEAFLETELDNDVIWSNHALQGKIKEAFRKRANITKVKII